MWSGSNLEHSWSVDWRGKTIVFIYYLSNSKPGGWRFGFEEGHNGNGAETDTFEDAVISGLESWGDLRVEPSELKELKGYAEAEKEAEAIVAAADAAYNKRKGAKKVTEGFSGLTVGGSDAASDAAWNVTKAIVTELRRQLKDKGNQYNTDGVMNVAMIIGERLQAWATEEQLQTLAKEVHAKLEKSDWVGEAGYTAVMRRLEKFIAAGD